MPSPKVRDGVDLNVESSPLTFVVGGDREGVALVRAESQLRVHGLGREAEGHNIPLNPKPTGTRGENRVAFGFGVELDKTQSESSKTFQIQTLPCRHWVSTYPEESIQECVPGKSEHGLDSGMRCVNVRNLHIPWVEHDRTPGQECLGQKTKTASEVMGAAPLDRQSPLD